MKQIVYRKKGKTLVRLGAWCLKTDCINRHEYNRLRKDENLTVYKVYLALRRSLCK